VAVVFSLRSLGDYHSQVLGGANSLKQELQHFRLNTDPDPGYDQKLTKNLQLKNKNKVSLDQKLQFIYPYATIKDIQVTKEAFSSQKREHQALAKKKFLIFFYFCESFLPSWIRIRIPNTDLEPDPLTTLNPIQSGSVSRGGGSETLFPMELFDFLCSILCANIFTVERAKYLRNPLFNPKKRQRTKTH
jgi:hypothetical protein